jgi:hypothetical protein
VGFAPLLNEPFEFGRYRATGCKPTFRPVNTFRVWLCRVDLPSWHILSTIKLALSMRFFTKFLRLTEFIKQDLSLGITLTYDQQLYLGLADVSSR